MSRMSELLREHRPEWKIPTALERAWCWMEEQGFGHDTPAGYALTPYAGKGVLGPVFMPGLTLEGWFEPGTDGHERLLPVAETAGDGSLAALWLDDDGRTRVVGLGSDGDAHVLAEDALGFVVLLAIGYDELLPFNTGAPPEDPEAVEAVAEFRSWVEEAFEAEVPGEWPPVGDDDFSAWADAQLGRAPVTAPQAPADTETSGLTGDAITLLDLLGGTDGAETAARVGEVAGIGLGESLRSSTRELRRAGIEAENDRNGLQTVWISIGGPNAYPRPGDLVHGLEAASTLEEALALLGEPERQGPAFLRYAVHGRYLHLEFATGTLTTVTLMAHAP